MNHAKHVKLSVIRSHLSGVTEAQSSVLVIRKIGTRMKEGFAHAAFKICSVVFVGPQLKGFGID